jgi:competence protein ComEC
VESARLSYVSSSGPSALLRAAAFAAGVSLPLLPVRQWSVVLAPLAVLTPLAARGRVRLFLLPLALGAAVTASHRLTDPLPSLESLWREQGFAWSDTPLTIEGRLLDTETLPEGRMAYLVRMLRFEIPGRTSLQPPRGRSVVVRLTGPGPGDPRWPRPRPGDLVEVSARVGRPRTFRNPGAFDYSSFLRARGIDLVGTVKNARLIRIIPGGNGTFTAFPARARRLLVGTIDRAAGGREDATTSFLAALLVGERDDLPQEFEDHLIRAGVYHIVALSGLNVALVVALASFLLRLLPIPPRARRALLLPCVVLYWVVARPSGSIARAALMALLFLAGAILGRRIPGTGGIASASMLILAANPIWIQDAGFQLSFAATLGLLLVVPTLRDRKGRTRFARLGGPWRTVARWSGAWLLASWLVSAAALISTSLVSARHFQTLTPVALVANLFAVPIAGLLLVLALLVCALEPLAHPAAGALIVVARFLVETLERMAAGVAAPEWCSFPVLTPPVWLVLAGQSAILLAGVGGARVRRAALVFLALAIAATAARGREASSTGRLEVVALDVGQGDALLVRFPEGPSMLVDAGGFARSRFDVGAKVVAPALRSLGLLTIDILAITHAHRDHLGGAEAVLRSFSPGAVWLGRMPDDPAVAALERQAAERGVPVVFPRRGARIALGGARLEVLNPGPGVMSTGPARNDDSLVLRLSFGGQSVLLTGDLESGLETALVGEGRDLRADLLKIGHHGSRTSTSAPFLRRVSPRVGVISVGRTNPWGHPDVEVVKRLEDAGVEVYRTDRDGAVRFTTDGISPWLAFRLTEDEEGSPASFRTTAGSPE